MTGEIVNLRRARKARARATSQRVAAENRVAFGRTKAERTATDRERRRAEQHLVGHRREPGPDETPP